MSIEAVGWALGLDLPSSAKLVAICLAYRAKDGECFPSVARLMLDTSMDRKTVLRGLGILKRVGVVVDTGKRVGKTRRVPVYWVNSPKFGIDPKNGTVKQSQISAETVPNFPRKRSQIWDPEKELEKKEEKSLEPEDSFSQDQKPTGLIPYSKEQQVGPRKQKPLRYPKRSGVRQLGVAERIQRHRSASDVLGRGSEEWRWFQAVTSKLGYECRQQTEAAEALQGLHADKPLLLVMWDDLKDRTKRWKADGMEPRYWPSLERYICEHQWEIPLKERMVV